MRKTMRLLSVLFLSMFVTPICGAAEPTSHQINKKATARAIWKIGQVTKKDIDSDKKHFETKFLGITTQGLYLAQEFYTDGGKKRSDPYLSVCPSEITTIDKEKFWKACKMTGSVVLWHKNGKKYAEGLYHSGKPHGLLTQWHEKGQKEKEGHYQDGKPQGLWIQWDENGKEVSRQKF